MLMALSGMSWMMESSTVKVELLWSIPSSPASAMTIPRSIWFEPAPSTWIASPS